MLFYCYSLFNKVLQCDEREGQLDLNMLLNHFDESGGGYWPQKKWLWKSLWWVWSLLGSHWPSGCGWIVGMVGYTFGCTCFFICLLNSEWKILMSPLTHSWSGLKGIPPNCHCSFYIWAWGNLTIRDWNVSFPLSHFRVHWNEFTKYTVSFLICCFISLLEC